MELAEIIKRFHLLVIGDDIYSFLSVYDHTAPEAKPFFSLVPEKTVHICSISKSLCAGLRVAFIAFPDQYRELLVSGMLGINLKTVSLNTEIITDHIERFFHWLQLPAHLTSEELELLALQKGIHVLGSHRFAMQNENKSSYVRVSVASPDTEDDLKKGLLILKNIFEEKQMHLFV